MPVPKATAANKKPSGESPKGQKYGMLESFVLRVKE
ncbi:MAG: hypothetical protein ACJATN_001076 [Neolewinella sp.]|jgi:hypothetical protein